MGQKTFNENSHWGNPHKSRFVVQVGALLLKQTGAAGAAGSIIYFGFMFLLFVAFFLCCLTTSPSLCRKRWVSTLNYKPQFSLTRSLYPCLLRKQKQTEPTLCGCADKKITVTGRKHVWLNAVSVEPLNL